MDRHPSRRPSTRARPVVVALGAAIALGLLPGRAAVQAMRPDDTWAPAPTRTPTATPPPEVVPAATQALAAALQTRLDALLGTTGIPGVSAAIEFPDGTLWVGTAGDADLGAGTAVTPETSFAIASVSKTFTAALILALVGDGAIGLDDPVDAWLPDLRLDPRVTVRQLLDHTSGLRDFFLAPGIDAALQGDPGRRWDAADALAYARGRYFKPGRSWHYSNTNYLILGMLAERVGGAPLADQLRDRFLEPLGLDHTWYQPTERPRGPLAHAYRMPRARPNPTAIDLSDGSGIVPFTSVVTAAGGAGGMASSASDLVRWSRALYAGDVLPPGLVRTMIEDADQTATLPPAVAYGLGVQVGDLLGHRTVGHAGRLLGARSVVRWLPDDRLAIAVLTNQSRTDPASIARALLKVVFASEATAPAATSSAGASPRP